MAKTAETEPSASALPLFAQVGASLRNDILGNKLLPGSKLPSEAELESTFGVSRITVRQALADLMAQGLITKVNGKGSFITRPGDAPRLGPLTGFYEHVRGRGESTRGKTLSVRNVKASAEVAETLRISPGTPLLSVTTLRFVSEVPVSVGILLAEPKLARALIALDINNNDVMSLLESSLGYRLKNMHIAASAAVAGRQRARQLDIAPEAPLLCIRFIPHDVNGNPLFYSRLYFRSDRFTYKAVIKR